MRHPPAEESLVAEWPKVQVVAPHCTPLSKENASSSTLIHNAVHIHPTVSELIPTLLGDLKPLE